MLLWLLFLRKPDSIEPYFLYSPPMIGMIPILVVVDAPADEHKDSVARTLLP